MKTFFALLSVLLCVALVQCEVAAKVDPETHCSTLEIAACVEEIGAAWDACIDHFDIVACIQDILGASDCGTCICDVLGWLGLLSC